MDCARLLLGEQRRPSPFRHTFRLLVALLVLASCRHSVSPQQVYDHARQTFARGDLFASQNEAEFGHKEFSKSAPEWALRFKVLEAENLMWRGMSPQVLTTLNGLSAPDDRSSAISIFTLRGLAYARLHQFTDANHELSNAERICAAARDASCGAVLRARGVLGIEQGKFDEARNYFNQSLAFARSGGDQFLEATALLNLGTASLQQRHFDDSIDWFQSAYQLSSKLRASYIAQAASGNLGWAYFQLGDSERALSLMSDAEERARQIRAFHVQLVWLTDTGYVQLGRQDYLTAERSYKEAVSLAEQTSSKEDLFNALVPLAVTYAKTDRFAEANQYSDRAIEMARADGNRLDELYPLLVKGQVAAQQHDSAKAAAIFREVATDPQSDSSLKWEAEHSLARLEEDEGRRAAAGREYEASLCTFETARSSVHQEESKLPFFTNASRIYDDYIAFLVKSGEANRALEVADFSRGRTLAEGLGLLRNERPCVTPPLNPERVAATAGATVLYYWMGQQQSYLWAITDRGVRVFALPPAAQIDSSARRYREALVNGEDVVASSNQGGVQLYQQLVMPAIPLLANGARRRSKLRLYGEAPRVIVVPDGSLNSLNFETLLVPGASGPHYWIEDAVISDAQSLRLLSAGKRTPECRPVRMLLVGDAISHNPEYPALPNAKQEIENVEKHFAPSELTVYTQSSATAAAFMDSKPEQYDYIHFVAHAVASSQVPLDSAVILSPRPGEDSFKLYAREIIQHSLRARLVTVSACYGAGTRSYNGEGLIGLSWAFLRAGARNTIGALWEVNDASTPQLMDYFYSELQKGRSPDVALRAAKLALIRSSKTLRKPFYWAPFQLYGTA
jgi:CHAT domain-containing protein